MAIGSVRTCLWYDGCAEEAADFYVDVIGDASIDEVFRPEPGRPALFVDFTLKGAPYQALNGGPHYNLSPAASIRVTTSDQAETDRLWSALCEGGEESRCGWLVDQFGLSWQIVPEALPRLLSSGEPLARRRTFEAMLAMAKIEIAALEAAHRGD